MFGRKTEEGKQVGADVMWIHSAEQTVFNGNVVTQNRPQGSGYTKQPRVCGLKWPTNNHH